MLNTTNRDNSHSLNRNDTNKKAINSIVLGILSIIFMFIMPLIGFVFAIIGLVFGVLGLREIKHTEQPGRRLAIAGLICSTIGIIFPIALAIVAYMFYLGPGETYIRQL